jgi:hypothetical protein
LAGCLFFSEVKKRSQAQAEGKGEDTEDRQVGVDLAAFDLFEDRPLLFDLLGQIVATQAPAQAKHRDHFAEPGEGGVVFGISRSSHCRPKGWLLANYLIEVEGGAAREDSLAFYLKQPRFSQVDDGPIQVIPLRKILRDQELPLQVIVAECPRMYQDDVLDQCFLDGEITFVEVKVAAV